MGSRVPLEIKRVPIASLKKDPSNARKHSEKNLKAIQSSLSRFGQVEPLVVQKSTGHVIGGNGRVEAMQALGIKEADVVELDLDNTQAQALGIALNRTAELAEWDEDTLGKLLHGLREDGLDIGDLGFDLDDLPSLGLSANPDFDEEHEDDVPEVEESFVKRGEIWQLGSHRLMCGDSTNPASVMLLMNGEKADLWLTDPPYGVSYADKNEYLNGLGNGIRLTKPIENDHMSLDESAKLWEAVATVSKENCSDESSYYWFACQGGDQMMMMMMSISRAGWKVRHELIWVKNNHVLGRCDYQYKHEPILFGWKTDGTHKFFGGFQTSVLAFDRPQASKLHPTMKPVELIELLINNSSVVRGRVLDTFLGSGSTLIACEKTGRRCFGMEIDPHYCSVIVKRWQDLTGKEAKKLG